MAALLFKVGLLTLKTAAKPLASRFEKLVLNHPVWRARVIEMAQLVHKMEVKITRGAEGRTGKAFVADMTEERALDLASKFVSEGFLYGMGVALVAVELQRKNKEDAAKKAKDAADKQAIRDLHERHLQAEKASLTFHAPFAALDLRAELRTMSGQLHGLDERLLGMDARLQFMEEQMGRRRGWLPSFGGGGG
ncbi:OPA3-like protein [Chlorella vulgaris]